MRSNLDHCAFKNIVLDDMTNWNAVMSTTRKCAVAMPPPQSPVTGSHWVAADPAAAHAHGPLEVPPQVLIRKPATL